MKAITTSILACITGAMALTACGQQPKPTDTIAKPDGFAVLELFTSEGCSSCPPADEAIAAVQKATEGKPVYILAYHVDYWNTLGWKDRYSNADFSKRQRRYGDLLNAQVYTPQLVVNGAAEFVGSDVGAISSALSNQLSVAPTPNLTLQLSQTGETVNIHYKATQPAKGSSLQIAIVQKNAQTRVERGENAGHTLSHVQIVRKLQTVNFNATGEGDVQIALPKELNGQAWEVIVLVQDQNTGKIWGAAKAGLDNSIAGK
ncbi:DUF1223 domain-containing protein [Mucilaginibacter celer]|uniref:DUF1223 domain-containing protein n=1 Tax=Mucilaginibacter celer TaxID=2305508 RepID=A0A494VGY8_9SPHI|nr:DUF1223 domain-containing protein [Mucilaginibacter celer]AYL93867.1 DUF1223 domain-containing protein [Mucilaginibacter celer]